MTANRELEREVRSWMREEGHEDAERVLYTVLDQLDTTPQRRAGWLARRFPIMNSNTIRYGIAAVVVVIAGVLGLSFLTPNVGGPVPTAVPTSEPTAIATAPPLGTRDPLTPGSYAVPGFVSGVTVTVPSGGWSSSASWVLIGPRGNEDPDGMAIRIFTATALYENPASVADGTVEVGPTVDDLVQAILDHPSWEASGPTDIEIDGHEGQMVQLSIPEDAQMSNDGRFLIFGDQSSEVWGFTRGQTFELYIVDVAGERIIIDAFHYPDTPEQDLAAQAAIVESIQFDSGN